ncbi:5-phosphohydroxy-L-lysine phospho-lyase [Ciona intestinalis]
MHKLTKKRQGSDTSSGCSSLIESELSPQRNNSDLDESQLTKEESLKLRNQHYASVTSLFFRHDPLMIVKGKKQYMYDENGNQYLDCINNVAHVGHCHPAVTAAATQQISQLYTNCRYLNDTLSTYAHRITELFPQPLNVCFLTNSGSEANDLALQLARAHSGGTEVITLDAAYHGHTQSCMDISPYKWVDEVKDKPSYVHVASSPDVYRGKHANAENPAHEYAMDVKHIINNIKQDGKQLSSFIMESMQSCGGQILPPSGYMLEAFRHVHEAGGLCIADEVQVGFGRVGTHYWAFETQGGLPDIVTIGKPMGNGHPISGVITSQKIAESFRKISDHYFNTFAGNPVSCAIGHAVLDVINDEKLLKHAEIVGNYALQGMQKLKEKHQLIGDVRGIGLFLGMELVKDQTRKTPATDEAYEILHRMKERFIIISVDGPHNNVLKFKPPMCFTKDNTDQLLQALDEVITNVSVPDDSNCNKSSTKVPKVKRTVLVQ